MNIRMGDMVEVISGDDAQAGRARKVIRVIPKENKVVVEGVNRTKKSVKPSQRSPQGGQLDMELPIDASNVLLFCVQCRGGVRIGHRVTKDMKERYCKKCGNSMGAMGKVGQAKKQPAAATKG
jgi:large subunit ribosomal protein L24